MCLYVFIFILGDRVGEKNQAPALLKMTSDRGRKRAAHSFRIQGRCLNVCFSAAACFPETKIHKSRLREFIIDF